MSDRPAWSPRVVLAVASLDSLSVKFLPGEGGGGVLNRCLGREVRPGRSNPDPV